MLNFWKKAIKMPSNLFWNCEGNIFLLIITENKTMPINRVSVFSLIHHLETQIWWVLNFNLKAGSKDSRAFDRGLMGPKK